MPVSSPPVPFGKRRSTPANAARIPESAPPAPPDSRAPPRVEPRPQLSLPGAVPDGGAGLQEDGGAPGWRRSLPGAAPVFPAATSLPMDMAAFLDQERAVSPRPVQAVVPNSARAGVLAGLVASFLHAGVGIEHSAALGSQLGTIVVNGFPLPVTPMLIAASLWRGARVSALAIFAVHAVLRRMDRTGLADYATGGAIVAGLFAGVIQAIGLGAPEQGWLFEVGTGLMAGLLYRLFAGVSHR